MVCRLIVRPLFVPFSFSCGENGSNCCSGNVRLGAGSDVVSSVERSDKAVS